jgi:hypothetical protein
LHAESISSGQTWVWTTAGAVVAYFTLVGHVIGREVLHRRLRRGSPDRIPAVPIARFALDRAHHGQGMGGVLLADASSRIVAATEIVAARFVVVDAYQPLPDTRRLVRKLSDLAHDLGNS